MQSLPTSTDVLIVGAGPTGLMLGIQLVRHGVKPLIIDKISGPSTRTKALGVQARTLEIYAHLGLAERAIELGLRATGADMWVNGRLAARVPLGDIGRDLSPYPFLLILGQDANERLLGDALHERGLDVHWNTELIELAQTGDRAKAKVRCADGSTAHIEAAWVAGCDGPHSVVRSLNGIDFVGAPYEHVFYVADTRVTGPMVPDELNVYLWRRGFHLFFPMRGTGHWRVVGIIPFNVRARDDLGFEAVMPSIRDEVGSGISFQECSWFSTYRIHHRRAARFRDRRCFLLGDAAHIHSPVGAQGMNTGLQDAYNLAWKLALVISGRCGADLLESYERERVPVADRLLKSTDRAFAAIVSDGWFARQFRTKVFPRLLAFLMRVDAARKFVFLTISQIGIRYRESPLSQTLSRMPRGAPQAGDRFPWLRLKFSSGGPQEDLLLKLDDTRFNLILFGQHLPSDISTDNGDLILAIQVPGDPSNDRELRRAGIPSPSYFLLRPDGHIGLAGTLLESAVLTRYLSERLNLHS